MPTTIFPKLINPQSYNKLRRIKMSKEQKAPQVRVVFEGEMAHRFNTVKEFYGFQKNADLIRLLVTLKYEEISQKRE